MSNHFKQNDTGFLFCLTIATRRKTSPSKTVVVSPAHRPKEEHNLWFMTQHGVYPYDRHSTFNPNTIIIPIKRTDRLAMRHFKQFNLNMTFNIFYLFITPI